MKITIFGVGGIGGYIAGKLGALMDEPGGEIESLNLVARGEHLQAIKRNGLKYIDVEGNSRTVRPTLATDDPSELPLADTVLLCVKGYDLEPAAAEIKNKVADGGAVLPLLNGADIRERVKQQLPDTSIYPGTIYISSTIIEPGTVQHMGGKGIVIFGKDADHPQDEARQLRQLFGRAGVPHEWHADAYPQIWTKYLFIAPFALATAVHDRTIGEILADEKKRDDVRTMMEEVAAIARAEKVDLPAEAVENALQQAANFPFETKTSFQRDVAAGKPQDERDLFGGTMQRLAEKHNVAVPVTAEYYAALP
ncbi:MAG: ketopantoate reductase family protein [Spirochaetota bacterium]